jgi:hypothetical protein
MNVEETGCKVTPTNPTVLGEIQSNINTLEDAETVLSATLSNLGVMLGCDTPVASKDGASSIGGEFGTGLNRLNGIVYRVKDLAEEIQARVNKLWQ